MAKPKHNQGRVETLRCADEIAERRAAGESIRWVYLDLADRGDLSITYNTFLRWVARLESGRTSAPRRGRSNAVQRHPARPRDGSNAAGSYASASRDSAGNRKTKAIGMGTPIPSPLNTEPDNCALFGEDQ